MHADEEHGREQDLDEALEDCQFDEATGMCDREDLAYCFTKCPTNSGAWGG